MLLLYCKRIIRTVVVFFLFLLPDFYAFAEIRGGILSTPSAIPRSLPSIALAHRVLHRRYSFLSPTSYCKFFSFVALFDGRPGARSRRDMSLLVFY